MNIFVCASKSAYPVLEPIIAKLEAQGFLVTPPNNYTTSYVEAEMRAKGDIEHGNWKADMLRLQAKKVADNDAVLIVNVQKGTIENYIGGAVLLEMYEAFRMGKPIYLWNPIPENMLQDEIKGMLPIIIHGDILKIPV